MTKAPTTQDILLGESWRQLFDCESWRVDYLVHFGESEDRTLRDRARVLLSGLRRREARHELCRIVLEEQHPWLNELLAATDIVPEKREDLILFLIVTKQWDRYLNEFGKITPLLSILSKSSRACALAGYAFREASDPAGMKLLLKLYADGSLLPAGIEELISSNLHLQRSVDCVRCIYEFWEETRNERIAQIIKLIPLVPVDDNRLRILLNLKRNQSTAPESDADLRFLIVCLRDSDHEISENARQAIMMLDGQDSALLRSVLFAILFSEPSNELVQVASQLKMRPESLVDRVLFCVLTLNWNELAEIDPDGNTLSQLLPGGAIHQNFSPEMKLRVSDCMRSSAKSEWVSGALGLQSHLKLSEMTDLDWQLLHNSLSSSNSWSQIWQLVPFMPALSARRFLRRLMQVDWKPEDKAEQVRFENLTYFAKRLTSEQVPIWSGVEYLGAVDLGGPLFGNPGDGGVESLENRFGFSNDGASFFFLDRNGAIRMWHLPSLLSAQFVVDDAANVRSIALSPRESLLAFSNKDNLVNVCDLSEKRVFSRSTHYESRTEFNVSNLSFSDSGNFLTTCLRRSDRNAIAHGAMWSVSDMAAAPTLIPQRAVISPNDEWLLYRTHGMIHLTTLDRKAPAMDCPDSFFRVREATFLPDSSAALLFERASLHLHELGEFKRKRTLMFPHELAVFVTDQDKHRILSVHDDYSFGFLSVGSDMQLLSKSKSFRPLLFEKNVWLAPVHDRLAGAGARSLLQFHKDPRGTHLAIVHAAGSISFWASPFSGISRKSPVHFSKDDKEQIRLGLLSSNLSEGELAWLRFISELSGSFEHYAVELGDLDSITINDFDIELV